MVIRSGINTLGLLYLDLLESHVPFLSQVGTQESAKSYSNYSRTHVTRSMAQCFHSELKLIACC